MTKQDENSIIKKLNQIRTPKKCSAKSLSISAAISLLAGVVLGIFSKWLDDLALDSTIWWHRCVGKTDLGNFFSDFAVWLLIALIISAFGKSPFQAALNVFLFFAGMCASYHFYTVMFSGFNPSSYMMIWYMITLLSPLLAVLCWYSKGNGIIPIILDTAIMAVFSLYCFSIGLIYFSLKGILYLLVFIGAAAVLYKSPKQTLISVPLGVLFSFLVSPIWHFR